MNTKILVVCHGSINRSPLAGYILRYLLPNKHIRIRAMRPVGKGEKATRKVRNYAQEMLEFTKQIDQSDNELGKYQLWLVVSKALEEHYSQQCLKEDLIWAEKIIYMDGGNLKRLQNLAVTEQLDMTGHPAYCLGEYLSPPKKRIADPAFMRAGSEELGKTLRDIVMAALGLAQSIRKGDEQ
jgi:protein-tyrosine-phosphatase